MKRVFGVLTLLLGATILLWVAYNLLIERQPAAEGLSPLPGIATSLAMIYVVIMWIRDKQAG